MCNYLDISIRHQSKYLIYERTELKRKAREVASYGDLHSGVMCSQTAGFREFIIGPISTALKVLGIFKAALTLDKAMKLTIATFIVSFLSVIYLVIA